METAPPSRGSRITAPVARPGIAAVAYLWESDEDRHDRVGRLRRHRALARFAAAHGFHVMEVFTDTPDSDGQAYDAMTSLLDRGAVRHIVVVDGEHLGKAHLGGGWLVRRALEQEMQVRVHLATTG